MTDGPMKPASAGESCSFLPVDATTRGCRQPRSCASCLETTGCMVNAVGECVGPQDEAINPSIDFRQAIDSGLVVGNAELAQRKRVRASQAWQFPADTVRYCAPGDTTCSACVRNNFWRANASMPDSRFCLGDDGACVCVDVCERPWYIREDCTGGSDGASSMAGNILPEGYAFASDDVTDKLWRGIMVLAAISFILMLLFLHKKCSDEELQRVRRLQARQARHARREARSRMLGGNALTLTGWTSYRRGLIDKEKALHAEGENKTESELSSDSELHSPTSGESTAYVSMDENTTSNPDVASIGASTRIAEVRGARASRLARYNEPTPGRQLLAPLQAGTYVAGATPTLE